MDLEVLNSGDDGTAQLSSDARLTTALPSQQVQLHSYSTPIKPLTQARDHSPAPVTIFNFSSYQLDKGETQLLAKGLSFSPTTKVINQAQFQIDLFKFCRNIRLKKYFEIHSPLVSQQSKHLLDLTHKFKLETTFDPDSACKFLNTYIECVRTDMESLVKRKIGTSDNLRPMERTALTTLRNKIRDKELSLVLADKGGGVVLLDFQTYKSRGDEYFRDNKDSYKLVQDSEAQLVKTILKARSLVFYKLLETKVILRKHKKFGENNLHTKVTGIKFLFKVHKSLDPEFVPLRPIHPSLGSPNHNLSLLLDGLINPYVNSSTIPSFLRDTNQLLFFCRQLDLLPSNTVIATSDISSLYTNIPHDDGVKILSKFLSEFTEYTSAQISVITNAVKHVVSQNYLKWQDLIYKQVRGVAMGTPIAVSYANIFMGAVDKALALKAPYILKHFRFIDDNFFLLPADKVKDLKSAAEHLGFPTIKSTWTVDLCNEGISFLDVWLSIKDNTIHSRLFTKPTDKRLYLHPQSFHPKHIINNIPYSILSRVRRLCSNELSYAEDKIKALQWLRDRGYDHSTLLNTIDKVERRSGWQHIKAIEDRHAHDLGMMSSISQSTRPPVTTTIPLVLTYNSKFKKAPSLLFKHRQTLAATLKQPHRTLVVFRRNKNLTDLLVHPSYRKHIQSSVDNKSRKLGFHHCHKSMRYRLKTCICGLVHAEGCRVCAHSVEGLSRLPKTKHNILEGQVADCHTRNVIYAIWCRVCAKIYIGETTQPLSTRLDQHLRLMKSSTSTKVLYQYFKLHHPSNALIIPIEVIRQLEPRLLQIKEANWINKLGTLIPTGLNTQLDLNQRYKGESIMKFGKPLLTSTPTPTRAYIGALDSRSEHKRTLLRSFRNTPSQKTKDFRVTMKTPIRRLTPQANQDKDYSVSVTPIGDDAKVKEKQKQKSSSDNIGDLPMESEPYVLVSPFIFHSPKMRGSHFNFITQRSGLGKHPSSTKQYLEV